MSYARWGWEGSDVYVFAVGGDTPPWSVECCGCWLNNSRSQWFETAAAAAAHLRSHEAAGQTVPADTYEEIETDRAEGLLR